jgi:hypothetical protein
MADTADLQAKLDVLRANGGAERDPIRFAYLNALARRAAAQPEYIRQKLNERFSAAASKLAARPTVAPTAPHRKNNTSPLANLLVYISQQVHAQPETLPINVPTVANRNFHQNSQNVSTSHTLQVPELRSVTYFHNTWSKLSTEQQLTETLAQAPENAGPMNSQHLVLRSLQIMNEISPDYLQGFMSYIDTLIWLEYAAPTKLGASSSSIPVGHRKRSK